MIAKKINKHKLILKRRLEQKKTLDEMSKIKNETLQLFIHVFASVKQQKFTDDDIAVFKRCEYYRHSLLKDNRKVKYDIFGLNETALVSEICAKAASKPKWCQLLYKIAKKLDNPFVFEIGTNLGISGTYLLEALKNKQGFFTTMEGLPKLCEIASNQFSTITTEDNFQVIQGLYDDTFPKVMQLEHKYNLIFIDGNHKKKPTLEYFYALKTKMCTPSIFVFDDIYWSPEMMEAWTIIKKDSDINFSIDLYEQGIAIIDKDEIIKNQNFNLHLSY